MDPAAFNPPKELREDIVYSVDKLINAWLEHEGREFRQAVANRLQRLVSGLPWLLSSLHPLAQNFILNGLRLHPPAATTHPATHASLPGPTEDVLPGPSTQPSRGKRRSRCRRSKPQSDLGISELPAVVSGQDSIIGLNCGTVYSGVMFCTAQDKNCLSPEAQLAARPVAQLAARPEAQLAARPEAQSPPPPHSASQSIAQLQSQPDLLQTLLQSMAQSVARLAEESLALSSVQQSPALHPVSVAPLPVQPSPSPTPPVQQAMSVQPITDSSTTPYSKQRDKPKNNVNIPQRLASSETEMHSRASPEAGFQPPLDSGPLEFKKPAEDCTEL
ncbi:uncharacterized protein LOC120740336, partial [Simochromis diagramma]|uniref:uncharacterized protein LOC120740336 n=1 Tax=Simochromis diagramma TaxID=43689 RepID=UPI001A7EDE14